MPESEVEELAPELPPEILASAPTPTGGPPATWPHSELYGNVIKTISTLPSEFSSSIVIRDFRATDIFTLNSALGASIEDSVVVALNKLRDLWDPKGDYGIYRFERQSQAFPDVRLVTDAPGHVSPLFGIELKGWYVVSKEAKPTFRYNINADVCAPQDLLVVFPWVLSDVIAGSPKLLKPFVGEARHAALYRNFYWTKMREAEGGNATIIQAVHRVPYPATKVDRCSDQAADDSGDNFGRIARSGLLNNFVTQAGKEIVSGIPVKAWIKFFKVFKDGTSEVDILADKVESAMSSFTVESEDARAELIGALGLLLEKLKTAPLTVAPRSRRRTPAT